MRRKLRFERLEDRAMMAGNVAAIQAGSTLILTGDARSNHIDIDGGVAGLTVVGELDLAGADTTVNGLPVGTFVGVRRVEFRMGAGDDLVHLGLNDFTPLQSVTGTTGLGNDEFILASDGGTRIGTVSVRMEGGDDSFGAFGAELGTLGVDLGSGDNGAFMDDVTARLSVSIRAGDGDDDVIITDSIFDGGLSISLGDGTNTVSIDPTRIARFAIITTGRGNDTVNLEDVTFDAVTHIYTGDGNDNVRIVNAQFLCAASIFLGEGQNTASLEGGRSKIVAQVFGGTGVDDVHVENFRSDGLFEVFLGAGNDSLRVTGGVFLGRLFASGGPGRDKQSLLVLITPKITVYDFEE